MKVVDFCRVCGTALCVLALSWGQARALDGDSLPLNLVAVAAKGDVTSQSKKKTEGGQKAAETSKQEKSKNTEAKAGKSSETKKSAGTETKGSKSSSREKVAQTATKPSKNDKAARNAKRKIKGDQETQILPSSSELPQNGTASWIGRRFHGKPVANGERYDLQSFTAAHMFAPFNSILKVTELDSGRSTYVRVNDRGPYIRGRVIDLSLGAARHLGYAAKGLTSVRVELAGNDSDPDLRYYVRLSGEEEEQAASPVEGFGPFERFDEAASLLADLHKDYPHAQLVVLKEKS